MLNTFLESIHIPWRPAVKFDIQTLLISAGSIALLLFAIRLVIKSKNSNNKVTNKSGNVVIGDKNNLDQK